MRRKSCFAWVLVVLLLVAGTLPALAASVEEVAEPDAPPAFSAAFVTSNQGYRLMGHFEEFRPDMVQLRPMYSLDGMSYWELGDDTSFDWDLDNLGTEDPDDLRFLQNQLCGSFGTEPIKSYLAAAIDSFYVKLRITLTGGEYYDTAACKIERVMQPIPEGYSTLAIFSDTMMVVDRTTQPLTTYGKYQLTVRADFSAADIAALLPDTVPVELQFVPPELGREAVSGVVQLPVRWRQLPELTLTAGETLELSDMAEPLAVPAGTAVKTPLGIYTLAEDAGLENPFCTGKIRLQLNVVDREEAPTVSLSGSRYDANAWDFSKLSLAFEKKPSGASAIEAYSFVEGDERWTALGDLLRLREVDANQSEMLYGHVDLLGATDEPYGRYLRGEIPAFFVGLIIKGGVYDGWEVMLPWPGDYDPPGRIPEIGGSGGNENNAGSGGDGGSDGSGQRPDLPGGGDSYEPPLTTPPGIVNPPDDEGAEEETGPTLPENPEPTTPEPPETVLPEEPSALPGGEEEPAAQQPGGDRPVTPAGEPQKTENGTPLGQKPAGGDGQAVLGETPLPEQGESGGTDTTAPPARPVPVPGENGTQPQGPAAEKAEAAKSGSALPVALTAAAVLVGGGLAAAAGTATAGGTAGGALGKTLQALRRLFFRR